MITTNYILQIKVTFYLLLQFKTFNAKTNLKQIAVLHRNMDVVMLHNILFMNITKRELENFF